MSGTKIRMVRETRGFSQEYMAAKLNLDQSSYSRLESNQTKLDVDTLTRVADILGVQPVDLLTNEPSVVNLAPNQGTQGIGHIENFYSFQKDLVEKVIHSKDQEILTLKEVISNLIKEKNALIDVLSAKK